MSSLTKKYRICKNTFFFFSLNCTQPFYLLKIVILLLHVAILRVYLVSFRQSRLRVEMVTCIVWALERILIWIHWIYYLLDAFTVYMLWELLFIHHLVSVNLIGTQGGTVSPEMQTFRRHNPCLSINSFPLILALSSEMCLLQKLNCKEEFWQNFHQPVFTSGDWGKDGSHPWITFLNEMF